MISFVRDCILFAVRLATCTAQAISVEYIVTTACRGLVILNLLLPIKSGFERSDRLFQISVEGGRFVIHIEVHGHLSRRR